MAENTNLSDFDLRTRANLAYIWSVAIIIMVGFTLWKWGSILAVLTLLIGFVTGTASTVLAVYFGSALASKKGAEPTVQNTGDNPTVNVTPQPEQPNTPQ